MEIKIKKIKNEELKEEKPKKKVRRTISKKEKVVTETLNAIDNVIEDKIIEPETIEEVEPINIQTLEWQYEIKEKSIVFYFFLFGFSALCIYLAYKYNNWFLALIVILGFVMIIQRNSKIDNFKIDETGVTIQKQKIEWSNIDRCSIESLNDSTLLIAIIPNTFPNLKIYIPFLKENERQVLYLINKYSKFTDIKSNLFDQITKKIMF